MNGAILVKSTLLERSDDVSGRAGSAEMTRPAADSTDEEPGYPTTTGAEQTSNHSREQSNRIHHVMLVSHWPCGQQVSMSLKSRVRRPLATDRGGNRTRAGRSDPTLGQDTINLVIARVGATVGLLTLLLKNRRRPRCQN